MKDILQDLVAHVMPLDSLQLVKITSSNNTTVIESVADDRSVVLKAVTKIPINEFEGTFGMPHLNKLDTHLKCPEYKENAIISVRTSTKDGDIVPSGLHFENENGDFENDYRFMSLQIVNEKMKIPTFKGASWPISITPLVSSIQKLKFQANAHSEETVFELITDNNDLIINFGDSSTHAGRFVFANNISGKLSKTWSYPVKQVISVLSLSGEISMKISDDGVMQISIDSGITDYDFFILAQTK